MSSKRHRVVFIAILTTLFFFYLQSQTGQRTSSWLSHPGKDVDWSRFAYTQYVTNSEYLCNSLMFFEALKRHGSRPDRVMMVPESMLEPEMVNSSDAYLLNKARDEYNVKLVPITIQTNWAGDATWADSYTKLLAFNQTNYDRVLSIDSDSLLLQVMDELFFLPDVPVAMPRAYWISPEKILSSQLMLIQPSEVEFSRIMARVQSVKSGEYDMEIVNQLYGDSALIFPHRRYDLLSGEFRNDKHAHYLGSELETWDPAAAYSEAKLIHFSDWPLPKPWKPMPEEDRLAAQPNCTQTTSGEDDCTARIIWNSLYTDFREKRKVSSTLTIATFLHTDQRFPGNLRFSCRDKRVCCKWNDVDLEYKSMMDSARE
ncbi:GNT1 alphan-acetylglucosamine transferase [Fusarium phyllophilum]|uniref:GNT1 alphan-acetylglucosamine transferase n=1 Tax=Fusarium phyllophilum TaxID=47803 RepID=A0A8H5JT79_9HYPO|nr:GNT1 alphan-acetylglucosamine transferase [Fusarium phyllophilum]